MAILKHTDIALYRRLLRQAKPCVPHIAAYLLCSLLATPMGLLTPVPLKIVVDNAIGSRPLPRILAAVLPAAFGSSKSGILIVAIVILVWIAIFTRLQKLATSLLSAYAGEKLLLSFRAQLFRQVQRLSVSYHDMKGTADSIYRIQYDAAAIQHIFVDGFIPFLTSASTVGAMLYVTLRIDWRLALVAMAISPLLYALSHTFRPRLRQRSREVKRLESSALSVVQEVLSALRVVKSFGREEYEGDRYMRRSVDGMRARIRLALLEGRYDIFVGLTTAVGTAAVLWIGVRHVQGGSLTLGALLLIMSYLTQLYEPLKTIGKKSASLQGHLAGAERAFSLLDRLQDVPDRPNARPLEHTKGAVSFKNVTFAYENGLTVLREITFDVPPGSRVGIAGRTGAGKTTLISLLTRFYDPLSGRILLDGIDLRDYRLADLRNQFAIVLQESVLFSTTIAENISYARPNATEAEIARAAQLANAHNFIVGLPQGYQTPVGERGMRLSGGERQRIALARAFLKDAPILLLDEPTSSVDVTTEAAIMEALERLMCGRTTFIIAHRLGTLANCDVRLYLENGQLVSPVADAAAPSTEIVSSGIGVATRQKE